MTFASMAHCREYHFMMEALAPVRSINHFMDAVALMRQIRDQMSREIEGMSYEEEKYYLKDRLRVKK